MRKKTGIEQLKELHEPKKKKVSAMDAYLILCITVIIIYTTAGIIFQGVTGMELSTALTVGVYGFFGGEITLLAAIKKWKLREGEQ